MDNKFQLPKSKKAACRPFWYPDPTWNWMGTTRDQGELTCEVWEISLMYFSRNNDNKNCLQTEHGRRAIWI